MFPGCYGDGKQKAETCCICGEPTERAGKGEDSIYIKHIGPFCQECWDVINEGVDTALTARLAAAEARYDDTIHFMDEVRNAARHRNPNGATILDFMAVWNEQYQDKLRQTEARLTAAEEAARWLYRQYLLRGPDSECVTERWPWLNCSISSKSSGGEV